MRERDREGGRRWRERGKEIEREGGREGAGKREIWKEGRREEDREKLGFQPTDKVCVCEIRK